MMRSMFSAVSGLRAHQTRMDVCGNNISNVNTAGYKSQRVTFSDVFSQTISNATAASDDTGRGGSNAMQVGLGVNVASIDMLMTQGSSQRTDNPFDLMITGDGFLVVGDDSGRYFTRNGALRLDDVGNLVIPNGMKVNGWPAVKDENGEYKINQQEVQPINLFTTDIKSSDPTATTATQLAGNLQSTGDRYESSIAFYDSQGNYYTMPVTFTRTAANTWSLKPANVAAAEAEATAAAAALTAAEAAATAAAGTPGADAANAAKAAAAAAKAAADEKLAAEQNTAKITDSNKNSYTIGTTFNQTVVFDSAGNLISPAINADTKKANVSLEFTGTITPSTGTSFGETTGTGASARNTISVDLGGLTQYAIKSNVTGKTVNGNAAGTLSGYKIGKNGIITASYSNGDVRDVAQVVVAEFDNPAGLEKAGENLYTATSNSGDFDGIGKGGTFMTGVLEMSNVDLSSEFTDMIITQRGFQANARIITVSDEMLQDLTNLKR